MLSAQTHSNEDFFDNNVPVQFMINQMNSRFDQSEAAWRAYLYWGVAGIERGDTDINDKEDVGFSVLDDDFALSKGFVEGVRAVCAEAEKRDWADIILDGQVYCWPRQLTAFVDSQWTEAPAGGWAALADEEVDTAVAAFIADDEAPHGGAQRDMTANSHFVQDFGWSAAGKVVWARLPMNNTMRHGDLIPTMRAQLQRWEAFEARARAIMGDGAPHMFQIVRGAWTFVEFSQSLVETAVSGVALAIGIGTAVMCASTTNVIMTAISIASVCCNVSCILALLVFAGWEVGVTESITIILTVGLSIDYVAHLAVAYQEAVVDETDKSAAQVREERVRFAMEHLGVSVLGGAATTAGSIVFLLTATMIFMSRFGQILLGATAFSFVFAHTLFLPLCLVAGPTHGRGDFGAVVRRVLCARRDGSRRRAGDERHGSPAVGDVEMAVAGKAVEV
mmetsp:Transcript_15763/g.54749  ORF Transcript_15763/g.54749 Transcript_15763/m.54749 type:complete len:449 (-) Transcript_15763:1082-2428(-)